MITYQVSHGDGSDDNLQYQVAHGDGLDDNLPGPPWWLFEW